MVSLAPLNLDFIVQEVARRVLQWGQLASSCFYFFEFLFFDSSENRGPISVCASYINQNSQYYLQPFTTVFHMTLDLFLNWSTILQGCWARPGKHNVGVEVIWEMSEAENKTSPHVAKCVCASSGARNSLTAATHSLGLGAVEFSRNTQSLQHCHFCTTSNWNELETVKSWISFNSNLCLS